MRSCEIFSRIKLFPVLEAAILQLLNKSLTQIGVLLKINLNIFEMGICLIIIQEECAFYMLI